MTYPLYLFRFWIDFDETKLKGGDSTPIPLCGGGFSECTGLEATMEPKVIKEGGRNYGALQRVGPVTFATVILKRGMTTSRDLWRWFELATLKGSYTYRLTTTITLFDVGGNGILSWQLDKALPIKFKCGDFNAKATDIGIEELHLAHEGLRLLDNPKYANLPGLTPSGGQA